MTATERSLRGKGLGLLVAAVIVAADLWSKEAVHDWVLRDGPDVGLLGAAGDEWLAFTWVENPGTMWGAFKNLSDVLPWVRVVAAVVVLAMMASTPRTARGLLSALGLVLGGAIGNIYDGFVFGAVRDFVKVDFDFAPFDPFPIFNVADSAICVGVALLALTMWSTPEPEDEGSGEGAGASAGSEAGGRSGDPASRWLSCPP